MEDFKSNSIDAVITGAIYDTQTWRELFRATKPGSHVAAIGEPTTYHRMAVAIENAGFEVRDQLVWMSKTGWSSICLARKPLEGTNIQNITKYGVGGLNIDGCRVGEGGDKSSGGCAGTGALHGGGIKNRVPEDNTKGRFPANILHDGSDEVVASFPVTKSGALTPAHTDRGKDTGVLGLFQVGKSHKPSAVTVVRHHGSSIVRKKHKL